MIQILASKYSQQIAYTFFLLFCAGMAPVNGRSAERRDYYIRSSRYNNANSLRMSGATDNPIRLSRPTVNEDKEPEKKERTFKMESAEKEFIGGPSQPEMSSFKSVGVDGMVNQFTGDFSYNIPLMDVGGYPINIFYNAGISMEDEASWVGLGWNINPGTISRNMRGVPDDFDGSEILEQTQEMKPNVTWGVSGGADFEWGGVKKIGFKLGAQLGASWNNYLGPALDLGVKGGVVFRFPQKTSAEKNAGSDTTLSGSAQIDVGLGLNSSSRYGFTMSPNVSMQTLAFKGGNTTSFGINASTSYNSRTGIKALQLSDQVFYNRTIVEKKDIKSIAQGTFSPMATTITFSRPSYIPTLRMPLTNSAYTAHFQLGIGGAGAFGSAEVELYKQSSMVASEDRTQRKSMVGYLYSQKAKNNPDAIMDFTRLNDNEVTPRTTIISAPQYSYDVFSIQGEGTGGSIRLYRNDHGYVRDIANKSKDRSLSAGADVATNLQHFGANFNKVKTTNFIGDWERETNYLRKLQGFTESGSKWQNVYFRNPGETSVMDPDQYNKIGNLDLVRFKIGTNKIAPSIETKLERFDKENKLIGVTDFANTTEPLERKKRTQVVSYFTATEATLMGFEKDIKAYDETLQATTFPRQNEIRKANHISEINVLESGGKRYIYGIPVYNTLQTDYTFSVNNPEIESTGKVSASSTDQTTLNNNSKKDGYLHITKTPAYAHSFLLTSLLSSDYVDVTNDGITEDDLGGAVKFKYSQFGNHKWRTPVTANQANFNGGNLTETKDDKGVVSYGERESWYVRAIESKTMLALFTVESRRDGKGVLNEYGGIDPNDESSKRLKKIDLYNKADLKKNGFSNAKPIKTVWFDYDYSLCTGTPDNADLQGKLTLKGIYFTYNGKQRAQKATRDRYTFSYTSNSNGNPVYTSCASDRWNTFKPTSANPASMKNVDFPYSDQDPTHVADINQNAGAWALKKILLPSGGQIEVEYESDQYAFVQDRRASDMMQITGLGKNPNDVTNNLYGVSVDQNGVDLYGENLYVFVKVSDPCTTKEQVRQKYLLGVEQLSFKLLVNMPKGAEYVRSYAYIDDYGVKDATHIWIKMRSMDGLSPLSLSALEYLREQLPGQAYPGYDVSESAGWEQMAAMLAGMWSGLKNAFTKPLQQFRKDLKAQTIQTDKSFVRINNPFGKKFGGGHRVKTIRLKDNWSRMTKPTPTGTGQATSEYGQIYEYETTEELNGTTRKISSGVASYEPSIGAEENPFLSMEQVKNTLPLGPSTYGAIEMPVLDAFFPAPVVGYSKITVRSLSKANMPAGKKSKSGVGTQVTEYFTAKDFPVKYSHTDFDENSELTYHANSFTNFFYKYAFDSKTLTQGFLVETNDMHGKIKSQSSYAENDPLTRINYSEYYYRNTGVKGLDDKFKFVHSNLKGEIREGNMGIDVELMTDIREFQTKASTFEVQGQLDIISNVPPIFVPFIWGVAGNSEDTYRAITTTKTVNYHSVIDSIVVIDKGSRVTTKNLLFDAETGAVVTSRTNNEFDVPIYNTSLPAYWAYSGMGLAYKNIDVVYGGVNFFDGKITSGNVPVSDLESGDELYLISQGTIPSDPCGSQIADSRPVSSIWVLDLNKNSGSLTNNSPNYVFIDGVGRLLTRTGVKFRVVRSGKRNLLGSSLGSIVTMKYPIIDDAGILRLTFANDQVVNAAAVEFKEKWQTDNDVIRTVKEVVDPVTCMKDEVVDCAGYLEKKLNPYRKGLLGNFVSNRSMVFYGERMESDAMTQTNLKKNSFLKDFNYYWLFNSSSNLVPQTTNTKWVWNSEITRINSKGLEVETKDALGLYTAAQYGYNKTTPVAIVNNSRSNDMAYEGFEDFDYDERFGNTNGNPCIKRQIDFPATSVVNTDGLGFGAHTGNHALVVNENSTITRTIPVRNENTVDFSLVMPTDKIIQMNDLGGKFEKVYSEPSNAPLSEPSFGASNLGMSLGFAGTNAVGSGSAGQAIYNVVYKTKQYAKIPTSGVYTFNFELLLEDVPIHYVLSANSFVRINFSIKTLDGGQVVNTFRQQLAGSHDTIQRLNQYLPCDTYIIETICEQRAEMESGETSSFHVLRADFGYTCTPYGPISYKTLDGTEICTYTKPIPAESNMINPVLTVPVDKPMLFSAWVRENCNGSSTTCNNRVVLQFNGTSTSTPPLSPSGPIIEGWQRYEGKFTVPVGCTGISLSLQNNSGSKIYFDDIRIHPFNANMKSYVYDPINLRLLAEHDANNYATFYEYDEEGTLIRTKAETKEGVKTITESRSAKQKTITTITE